MADLHVLHSTSYQQNAFYIPAQNLTQEERAVVERDMGEVKDGYYYHLGARIEDDGTS